MRQDKPGLYPYEARVEPIPGEATQANNSATYLLRVVDQPVRVMLLEGKPYWDSKFLVRTLSSTPAVELDSIVRVAEGRLMRRTCRGQRRTDRRRDDRSRLHRRPPAARSRRASRSRRRRGRSSTDAAEVLTAPTGSAGTRSSCSGGTPRCS